jgi:hypothetical protein
VHIFQNVNGGEILNLRTAELCAKMQQLYTRLHIGKQLESSGHVARMGKIEFLCS